MPRKISQMTAATLPLVGDEYVPIIQSGNNRRATVSDIAVARGFGGPYNLKVYGARGDGSHDDTSAIQDWFDDAPNGSVLYAPAGKYVFSNVTTGNKTLFIYGDGFRASSASGYFGTASYLNQSLYSGTVFFCSATSGVGWDCNPASAFPVHLRNLAVVGPGSGTSTGVRMRSATAGNPIVYSFWENVAIFNFYNGLDLSAVLNCNFLGLQIVGTSNIGVWVQPYGATGSNNNSFDGLSLYFTGTYGMKNYDSGATKLYHPLIQNIQDGNYGLHFDGSVANNNNDNLIIMPWAEHSSGAAAVNTVYVASGRNTEIFGFHGGTRATITFAGGTGHKLGGKVRFTYPGVCLTIGAGAADVNYDRRDIDLANSLTYAGTISDSSTSTIDKALLPAYPASDIANSSHVLNTTNKYDGKEVWDSTNLRIVRASGPNATDRWNVPGTGYFITPNGTGGAGMQTATVGSGNPEGSVTAPINSMRWNGAGGARSLFIKQSGTGNTGWRAARLYEDTATAAAIAAIGNAINTTDKHDGKLVWDSTNNRMMRASGGAAGDVWWVIDGSASVTPV